MYIKKYQYGGVDYHDAKERIWQLKWNDQLDVPEDEVSACIFADLMERFPYADGERIQAALRGEETYSFPILIMEDGKLNCGEVYDGRWSEQADVFGYKCQNLIHLVRYFMKQNIWLRILPENVCAIFLRSSSMRYIKGRRLLNGFTMNLLTDMRKQCCLWILWKNMIQNQSW